MLLRSVRTYALLSCTAYYDTMMWTVKKVFDDRHGGRVTRVENCKREHVAIGNMLDTLSVDDFHRPKVITCELVMNLSTINNHNSKRSEFSIEYTLGYVESSTKGFIFYPSK